jgi:hypothetical protein
VDKQLFGLSTIGRSSRAKHAEKHLAGKTLQPIFAVPKNEAKLAIGRQSFV